MTLLICSCRSQPTSLMFQTLTRILPQTLGLQVMKMETYAHVHHEDTFVDAHASRILLTLHLLKCYLKTTYYAFGQLRPYGALPRLYPDGYICMDYHLIFQLEHKTLLLHIVMDK